MKNYWEEIGFKPADFKLDDVEASDCDDNLEDLPIKENKKFALKHKKPYSGLAMKKSSTSNYRTRSLCLSC